MNSSGAMSHRISEFFTSDPCAPFRTQGWRGCVLDRDLYSIARMPRTLWEALVDSAAPEHVFICGLFAGSFDQREISSDWSDLQQFMLKPTNYSPQYLLFDLSQRWAILADQDVTTLGAELSLRNDIDAALARSEESLLKLTLHSFPESDIAGPSGTYVRKVVGI